MAKVVRDSHEDISGLVVDYYTATVPPRVNSRQFICYDDKPIAMAEVTVNVYVVRSGRNLIVVAIEFKLKDSERLAYLCRATFYNTPVARL
ncbi:acyl-coenzyme A thioesterase 13 [Artemisia annua]|uniref:Acyl-coenzyme A thioesterase 13 n=1 Tax=Artemisia annua TaxID=35608 RepID=A0A2U1PIS9_ARTAN|nr:acyl-coenzyme A thioesterase 13 [Artemisia annua]